MALRWIEGFETDQDTTDFQRKYASAVNSGSWAFVNGPKVGQAMQAGGNADSELRTKALVAIPENTWVVGIRVRVATAGTVAAGDRDGGITFFRGTSDQVEIRIHSLGANAYSWRVYRGATLLGETTSFWDSDWLYWEFKVACRTGTNGSVQIKVRDTYHGGSSTTFFTLSGINTANSGTDGADVVRMKFQFGNNGTFDDIYILDTSGSVNNDFLSGDVVVFGSSPNSDGAQLDWTPSSGTAHFSLVNDSAGAPTDATKVKSQTTGNIDLYNYQDLALVSTGQTILGIMLGSVGGMETTGTRTLRHRIRDSGGSQVGGANFVWSTTPQQHQFEVLEQNPVLSVAWTKASVDGAQFGIEVVS